MIDTEKMRDKWPLSDAGPDDEIYDDLHALCREVEHLRRRRLESEVEALEYSELVKELRREVERLRDELRTLDGYWRKGSSKQMNAAFERVRHGKPADETTAKDEPGWLPAPDTMPEELAPAQMIVVREPVGWGRWPERNCRADSMPWGATPYFEYRPLYSDSGLPLCSAEGLEPESRYVFTPSSGLPAQSRKKPRLEGDFWEVSGGRWSYAPESHRRPGPWIDSLMEVMR